MTLFWPHENVTIVSGHKIYINDLYKIINEFCSTFNKIFKVSLMMRRLVVTTPGPWGRPGIFKIELKSTTLLSYMKNQLMIFLEIIILEFIIPFENNAEIILTLRLKSHCSQ